MPIFPSLRDLAHLASIENIQAKVGNFTRDMSLATGAVSYTGVGFKPDFILFMGCISSAANEAGVWGAAQSLCDGWNSDLAKKYIASVPLWVYDAAEKNQYAFLNSYDDDGFTLGWNRGSTPTSILTIQYLALKRSGLKVGGVYTTRVMSVDSGDVAYTGFGFKPTVLFVFAGINNGISSTLGVAAGWSAIATGGMLDSSGYTAGNKTAATSKLIWCYDAAAAHQYADVKSFDDDGVTLTWTKSGNPTATIDISITGLR